MAIEIEEVTEVTPALVEAVERLMPQLTTAHEPPTREELCLIVAAPDTALFTAYDSESGATVGMMTLVTYRIPTGVRAWIEDVVVDQSMRGRGIGSSLTSAALQKARAVGAATADLTSRSMRQAATRLYSRTGFSQRDTNVYRIDLDKGAEKTESR